MNKNTEIKTCLHCQRSFSPKRETAKYCSDSCRTKHWLSQKETKKAEHLKDNLRGVIKENSESETPRPSEVMEIITIDNPAYITLKNRLAESKRKLNDIQQQEKRLIARLDQLKIHPESMATIVGMGCGAIIAREAGADTFETILAAGVSSVLLTKLSQIGKEERDLARAQKIEEINAQLIINSQYKKHQTERIADLMKQTLKTPSMITTEVWKEVPKTENFSTPYKDSGLPAAASEEEAAAMIKNNKSTSYSTKVLSSKELSSLSFMSFDFKGHWLDFLGNPKIDFFCVIHGKPGQGKSTFAIAFAKYLAENFGRAIYISAEEGFSLTLKNKIISTGAASEGLDFADISRYEDITAEVPTDAYNFIFIDSLDRLRMGPAQMKEFRERYKDSAIIAICQSTKNGGMRGSQEIAHDDDITIAVEKGVATTTKNRFASIERSFSIF